VFTEFNIRLVENDLKKLTQEEDPIAQVVRKISISVSDIGIGVWKYVTTADLRYRKEVENHATQFGQYKAQFDQLAKTEERKALGSRLGLLYKEYQSLRETLMKTRDEQESVHTKITENFQEMSQSVHEKIKEGKNLARAGFISFDNLSPHPNPLPSATERTDPSFGGEGEESLPAEQAGVRDGGKTLETVLVDMEQWIEGYLGASKEEYQERFFDDVKYFQDLLAKYKNEDLSGENIQWIE
jgi:hypothetical protein